MDYAMQHRFAAMEAEVKALREIVNTLSAPAEHSVGPIESRVRDLENKYRMLNARLSRKREKEDAGLGKATRSD